MGLRWEAGERVGAELVPRALPRPRRRDARRPDLRGVLPPRGGRTSDPPDPAEYLERYPEVAPALRRVLDIHGLVGSGTATGLHDAGRRPRSPSRRPGETIAGFHLVEELGRGAFARVFLARERQLADRPVALKVARTGSREPQTLARLQHTHIVPVHSYRTDPATGLHLLCMPYFGRVTLARVLADPKVRVARIGADLVAALDRLGPPEPPPAGRSAGRAALSRRSFAQAIAWWGARMAEALEHAHDRGVLHRDVKPSNVLVTADGMPMLLDFNLAREVVLVDGEADRAAVPGGTLDYMAPEHLEALADGARRPGRRPVRRLRPGRPAVRGPGRLAAVPAARRGVVGRRSCCSARPSERRAGAAAAPRRPPRGPRGARRGGPPLPGARPRRPLRLGRRAGRRPPAVADDAALRFAREPWASRVTRWASRNRRRLAVAAPVVLALAVIVYFIHEQRVGRVTRYVTQGQKARDRMEAGDKARQAGNIAVAIVEFEQGRIEAEGVPGLDEEREKANHKLSEAREAQRMQQPRGGLPRRRQRPEVRPDHQRRRSAVGGPQARRAVLAVPPARPRGLRPPARVRPAGEGPAGAGRPRDRRPAVRLAPEARPRARARRRRPGRPGLPPLGSRPGLRRSAAGPWAALRARLESDSKAAARLGQGVPDSPAAEASASACFQWALLRNAQGRLDEAILWLDRAVDLDYGNGWYHYALATFHDDASRGRSGLAARHHDRALEHYSAAVASDTRSPYYRFGLARHYLERQALPRALDEFLRAQGFADRWGDRAEAASFRRAVALNIGVISQYQGDVARPAPSLRS